MNVLQGASLLAATIATGLMIASTAALACLAWGLAEYAP
jgi:hypothetical protein